MILEHLALYERHVAQGEAHLASQHAVIARLEKQGHDTESAKELLATLEWSQANHVADRDRIRKEFEEATK